MAKKIGSEVEGETVVTTGNLTENFKILELTRDCLHVLLVNGGWRRGETLGSGESEVMELECFEYEI